MTTITRADLRQRVGRAASCYRPVTTTAAGLSDGTTFIDATRFRDKALSPLALRNALALAASGSAAGEIRRVYSYEPDSGKFLVSPPFSAQIAASTTMELWTLSGLQTGTCDGVEKELVHQAIDDGLARLTYNWRHYLTLVTDGDMETSGTTNWTASNATLTKSTTVVGEGKQSLRVQNSVANGYGRTANIPVLEDETYILEATFYANSGTPNLIPYDVTNSAAIDTIDPADSDQLSFVPSTTWARLWASLDIPSGCKLIQIRLAGEESDADIYWENIILRRVLSLRETLPSWVTNANNIKEIVTRPLGDRYGRERWRAYPYNPDELLQAGALVPQEWNLPGTISDVIAVDGYRPSGPLTTAGTSFATNDAVTVSGSEDEILGLCMVQFWDALCNRAGENSIYAQRRAEWAAKVTTLSQKRKPRETQPLPRGGRTYRNSYWR